MHRILLQATLLVCLGIAAIGTAWGGSDRPSEFTNQTTIINTRHNLTQRSSSGADLLAGGPNAGGADFMDSSRNNYGEVCVYCHTPHGANSAISAPLWNRAIPTTTYQTYNQLGSGVTQSYSQPGAASLSCLSCHDGQQAVDAILNMPGSGRYNASPDNAFLETWSAPSGYHAALRDGECLICHSTVALGNLFTPATDFAVFVIGTDLRNDHPVGVTYPTTNGTGTDWKTPNATVGTTRFFDENSDGRMQKSEIRLYNTGQGPEVECGTCHDPHGVPSGGPGSTFNASFLRKTNAASAVCLTCHSK